MPALGGSLLAWLATLSDNRYNLRLQQCHPDDLLKGTIYFVLPEHVEASRSPCAAVARVVGVFNAHDNASSTDLDDISCLVESARQVFQAQLTRRFLHGFQICGSAMELWVFDRSGPYSREAFDIQKRPGLFTKTMARYAAMSDSEAGLPLFTKQDDQGRYVAFSRADETDGERLYLETEPIAAPDYITGPGTTCYAAKRLGSSNPVCVVKFAWREDKIHTERELLETAKERNVWGVVRILGCQDLESTQGLRQGLKGTQPSNFQSATTDGNVAPDEAEAQPTICQLVDCLGST